MAMEIVVDVNLTGAFLCTQEAFKLMKSQTPGWAHHQQWIHLAHTPRPNSARTRPQACHNRSYKSHALDGRKYDIACGQIDMATRDRDGRTDESRHSAGSGVIAQSRRWTSSMLPVQWSTWQPAVGGERTIHDDHGDKMPFIGEADLKTSIILQTVLKE